MSKVPFYSVKYIIIVAKRTSRTFSSGKTEILDSFNVNSLLSPAPGSHHFTFFFYECNFLRYRM